MTAKEIKNRIWTDDHATPTLLIFARPHPNRTAIVSPNMLRQHTAIDSLKSS